LPCWPHAPIRCCRSPCCSAWSRRAMAASERRAAGAPEACRWLPAGFPGARHVGLRHVGAMVNGSAAQGFQPDFSTRRLRNGINHNRICALAFPISRCEYGGRGAQFFGNHSSRGQRCGKPDGSGMPLCL
jgi:hypothetical protein